MCSTAYTGAHALVGSARRALGCSCWGGSPGLPAALQGKAMTQPNAVSQRHHSASLAVDDREDLSGLLSCKWEQQQQGNCSSWGGLQGCTPKSAPSPLVTSPRHSVDMGFYKPVFKALLEGVFTASPCDGPTEMGARDLPLSNEQEDVPPWRYSARPDRAPGTPLCG